MDSPAKRKRGDSDSESRVIKKEIKLDEETVLQRLKELEIKVNDLNKNFETIDTEMKNANSTLDKVDSKIQTLKNNKIVRIDTSRGGENSKPNVLFGVSGSVAAIKTLEIVQLLLKFANVKIVTTNAAKHFFFDIKNQFPAEVVLQSDQDEWDAYKKRHDPVLHIELRKWADIMLIAPLSANTLAKISNGICDNLLTSVVRAWDFKKPIFVAPAMNTMMWEHPLTSQQLKTIARFGVEIISPISKQLECKDVGLGAMETPVKIVDTVKQSIVFYDSSSQSI